MTKMYEAEDLCCGVCAQRLEVALNKIPDVEAKVFFALGKVKITAPDEKFDEIFKEVKRVAKIIEPDAKLKEIRS
ncbi:MAG: heavy-metal-associated domain-containing protein [Clostridia bacterium]|nr:heavy-metal-associated domain-containing protein [Clostridia bacterium]MBP5593066.1 heavy-metal-associated domain-containing protein [Clostridia bacterium]MBP5649018.1 heavy-metal-associated domain-containing protein [Clostridia bacterium]